MSDPYPYFERMYTYGGRVAHLVHRDPVTEAGVALCGYIPRWPACWLGSGSYFEIAKAERLRACSRCGDRYYLGGE